MQFLRGYKLYMGGLAALFLAVGGVLEQGYDDVPVDWNRTATDISIGISLLGAAFKTSDNKPA